MTGAPLSLSADHFRSALFTAQSLPGQCRSASEAVEKAGLVRTLGGVDVYLAVRARVAGLERAQMDEAVERCDLQVVPAVRGCIYLVPHSEVPWTLRIAGLLSRRRREREHDKAGIRTGELDEIAEAVLATLGEKGPLTTSSLRRALPEGLVRSLGDGGKKVGISSPLPPALRQLEFDGRIERTLEGGKLDTERYLWRVAEVNPFDQVELPEGPTQIYAHFAELYLRTAGIGTTGELATWAGIGKRDAGKALATLDTVAVEVSDVPGGHLALEATADLLCNGGRTGGASLLPFEDNLIQFQGGAAPLVDPTYHDVVVPLWGRGKPSALGDARHMSFRSIALDGRIVGFWEYDPDQQWVVTTCFERPSGANRREVEAAAEDVGAFIRDQLGHGKSFSLDTDKDLRRRIGQLVEMGA